MFKLIAIATAILVPVMGQDAKIMIVEKADSQKLARAYREYKDAQKRWEELKTSVAKQYTHVDGKAQDGWDKVQFSADFRAIVPETSEYASKNRICSTWGYGFYPSSSSTLTSNAVTNTNGTSTTLLGTLPMPAATASDLHVSLDGVRDDIKTTEKN